ncbi:outer membrane lipoprotein-sorting protein, partial [Desulfobulbus sp. N2]|nr:outer membrane lipoprotein-sorting protein [Desulfobulbus sp. N2]
MKFSIIRSGVLLLGIFFSLLCGQISLAETPEEKGLAIVMEAERRDQGFGDLVSDMVMILQ